MIEMKCPNCGRFIGVLDGEAQIKCPRCKQLVCYRSKPDLDPDPDRDISQEDESSTIH
jgi:hypothetical protein